MFPRFVIEMITSVAFSENMSILRAFLEQLENKNTISSLEQKLKQKEEQLEFLTHYANDGSACYSEQKECGTCFELIDNVNQRPMVFFPCGHARYCESCYGKLPNPKKCPDCRVKIQKATILYY